MLRTTFAALVLSALPSAAFANDLVVTRAYMPVAGPVYVPQTTYYAPAVPYAVARPVVTYSPVVPAPAPVVTYAPVIPAPAPVVTYYAPQPVTTYYAPAPVTTYYAPQPTVAYSPVYGPVAVPVGPGVTVRSKVVNVPGQPVRNFFRTITP